MKRNKLYKSTLVFIFFFTSIFAQDATKVKGIVVDELGGVIVGVEVILKDSNGSERKTITTQTGNFSFNEVNQGNYLIIIKTKGFKTFENSIKVTKDSPFFISIKMEVSLEKEIEVSVDPEKELSIDNNSGAGQIIIKEKNLDLLPDDPEALLASLQALSGGANSLDGGSQIYIDGIAGKLPPKSSILEVRVNQNQLNAEFDRAGFGRIDVTTKPGTEKLQGSTYFNFSDDALVSRNPFVLRKAPYQTKLYGGNIGKSLIPKKVSFFADIQKRDEDTNVIVNSRILNPLFEPTIFSATVQTPARFITISPRFDIKLNDKNYLTLRYSFTQNKLSNRGTGDFLLLERAYPTTSKQHLFQITETSVLSPKTSNEFRFQFSNDSLKQSDTNSNPSTVVQDSFVGGGSGIGLTSNNIKRLELQNYLTTLVKGHTFRYGLRVRTVSITDNSLPGYNGIYTFAGKIAPKLNVNNQIILDTNGNPVLTQINSLESYRRTLVLQNNGFSPAEIRRRGGGASLFAITTGNPLIKLNQFDIGGFFQDEWRLKPNLSVGVGLRYENQTNIKSNYNFAPRLFFAWAPGKSQQPKLVVRGGFGIFYDRSSEQLVLQSKKFNGVNQLRYFITDPTILDTFPNVPTAANLNAFANQQSLTSIDGNLKAPYSSTFIINAERQLPFKIQSYVYAYTYRTRHVIRLRNINAPLPGTFLPPNGTSPGIPGLRPNSNFGEIFFYESSGNFSLSQATFGIRRFFKNGSLLFSSYILGKVKSDSESLPANSYNLQGEYSDASFDSRHRFIFGGNFIISKLKLSLSPFLTANSGRPFNITTGIDNNGDRVFTDRPSIATAQTLAENLRRTDFGDFDIRPLPNQSLIPRNFGRGKSFFSINLNLNRTFDLKSGDLKSTTSGTNQAGGQMSKNRIYKLTVSLQVQNILNRTNPDVPNGNLSSTLFGQSVRIIPSFGFGTPAGFNRRVEVGLRFNF
jgi:hypothetical protein